MGDDANVFFRTDIVKLFFRLLMNMTQTLCGDNEMLCLLIISQAKFIFNSKIIGPDQTDTVLLV